MGVGRNCGETPNPPRTHSSPPRGEAGGGRSGWLCTVRRDPRDRPPSQPSPEGGRRMFLDGAPGVKHPMSSPGQLSPHKEDPHPTRRPAVTLCVHDRSTSNSGRMNGHTPGQSWNVAHRAHQFLRSARSSQSSRGPRPNGHQDTASDRCARTHSSELCAESPASYGQAHRRVTAESCTAGTMCPARPAVLSLLRAASTLVPPPADRPYQFHFPRPLPALRHTPKTAPCFPVPLSP